ncbi:MAG: metalloregulator ArsR/SmtB family transcription factor [Bacteroidia bacterium]|nr:metalloregulator ArsR/SmtB family transcription factor [Bacteroidia bacterium]
MEAKEKSWTVVQRELMARSLRALAHPVRLSIIELLIENGNMSVTDIYTQLGLDQSTISHHLSLMKSRKILACQRTGKNIYYHLNGDKYLKLIHSFNQINLKEDRFNYN